jgi:Phage integrase family
VAPQAQEAHLGRRVGADADAFVFTGPQGGPLRYSAFHGRLWRPTLRRLGLPEVGIHVTRHSKAAALISAGASPKAIQVVMGHSSAAFTLTAYGHLFEADLDALAERLDERRDDGSRSVSRHSRGISDARDALDDAPQTAYLRNSRAPGRIRTCDARFRKPFQPRLRPAVMRRHAFPPALMALVGVGSRWRFTDLPRTFRGLGADRAAG